MAVIYASASDFAEKTKEGTIILDFYAEWCAPCRMLGPVLEQIADENTDIKVVKVNVDENQSLAQEFGVRGIPALYVLKDGKNVANRSGFMPKEALIDWAKNA